MKAAEYFCSEFMDIMRELREGTLPLDEALGSLKDLELDLAKQLAKEKLR